MARITAGVGCSHVPAIGVAMDTGNTNDDYWKPVFNGFKKSREWMKKQNPDVIFLVYNDHCTAFDASCIPTFAHWAVLKNLNQQTKVGDRAQSQWLKIIKKWPVTLPNLSF